MLTLSFDTSLDKTYIVLGENGEVLTSVEIQSDEKNYHSAYLISTIADILKKHNKTPKDIKKIGVNIGPGSFTGIRAGVTVARVLAQETNAYTFGISSLEILANTSKLDNPIVILDARKNMGYLWDNKVLGAIELEEIDKIAKERNIITDNTLFERYKDIGNNVLSYQEENFPLGKVLYEIITNKDCGPENVWQNLKPLYIQPPPVTLKRN